MASCNSNTKSSSVTTMQLQEPFSISFQASRRDQEDRITFSCKKRVSWMPGTVDNEPLQKKTFEKEFFFSQDIWG
ncbi:unnamed protein product [Calypogeia fissa]